MSVINKMLRDLDARHSSVSGLSKESGTRVTLGTTRRFSYRATSPAWYWQRVVRWLLGLLVMAAVGAAVWYFMQEHDAKGEKLQAVPTVPKIAAPASDASASMPVAAVVASAQPASSASPVSVPAVALTTSPPVEPSKPPAPQPAQAQAMTQVKPPAQSPMQAPIAAATPPRLPASAALPAPQRQAQTKVAAPQPVASTVAKPLPAPVRVESKPAAKIESAASVPVAQAQAQAPRQNAAEETLTQAQNLWAKGSRDAALDLMREAVAVAERAHQAGTLAGGTLTLASLVRELARMELAQGQVNQVLAMLTRLEPALSDQADLWAVRGNAAQRLGRHQESVDAYFRALALRSDEPRWMLGAAVSLAALGRLEAAAEQAEKARATGTVSPEILAYLRQAGVPLK